MSRSYYIGVHPRSRTTSCAFLLRIACTCVLVVCPLFSGHAQEPPAATDASAAADDTQGVPSQVEWSRRLESRPALAGGSADAERVYVPLEDGQLVALSRETGEVVWSHPLETSRAPALLRSLLYVLTNETVHALDPATGRDVARLEIKEPLAGSVTGAGGRLLVPTESGDLLALDAEGTVLWRRPLGAPARVPVRADSSGEVIVAALADGRLVAVAGSDGRALWSRTVGGELTIPLISGGRVFVGATTDALYSFDLSGGRLLWAWQTGGDVVGATVDEDRVYAVALDNLVRAHDLRSGNLRWQQVIGTRPVAAPTVSGSHLIVPGVRPHLVSYVAATGMPAGIFALPPEDLARLAGPPIVLPEAESARVDVVLVTRDGRAIGVGLRPEDASPEGPAAQRSAVSPQLSADR